VLKLSGAFAHNPKRLEERRDEPLDIEPLQIEPPAHLPWDVAYIWREMRPRVIKGTVDQGDVMQFEAMCRLALEMRLLGSAMSTDRINALTRVLGSLGLTPADRSRIRVKKPQKTAPEGGFGGLLGKKSA